MIAETLLNELRIGPRKVIKPGDRFRLSGGTKYAGGTMPPRRGLFELRKIWTTTNRGETRTFVDAVEIDSRTGLAGGSVPLFVAGKPYRRKTNPGVVFFPYVVRSATGQAKKRAGKR